MWNPHYQRFTMYCKCSKQVHITKLMHPSGMFWTWGYILRSGTHWWIPTLLSGETRALVILAIILTKSTNSLFRANYLPLMSKIYTSLTHISKIEIGRFAAFKMMVLPQLLYLELFLFVCLHLTSTSYKQLWIDFCGKTRGFAVHLVNLQSLKRLRV